ncbi:cryptochrome dash [Moniliophthora roreri]|uniref:Cryptochrome DASH n=1 Tax=Moniliophthora roreri TaxID=221103 RepID=A0A0W0F202_MONRR|nr:cryptochrome dash [Moniliophthora roreri]
MYLIYLLRRDLRVSDNPILHALKTVKNSKFTHLLPLYVLSPTQVEVSGFLSSDEEKSPYPEARSRLAGFWRCGPYRAKFLAESLWDLKSSFNKIDSDLIIRIGLMEDIVRELLEADGLKGKIGGVWLSKEWGSEEIEEERKTERVVREFGGDNVEWKVWNGEQMLIHDDDLPFQPSQTHDVFTTFRKTVEPLRNNVRKPCAQATSLRPLPSSIPPQSSPFSIPSSLPELVHALQKPVLDLGLSHPITKPAPNARSAHPFTGGETNAHKRVIHLLASGSMSSYKDTRNALLGEDFSTKLAGYLSLGCITARQINAYILAFEEGKPLPYPHLHGDVTEQLMKANGYAKGENKGTAAVRFELLWRDYMQLCLRKYGTSIFSIKGFRGHIANSKDKNRHYSWSSLSSPSTRQKLERFLRGETGTGFIDASMRELALTGYTSNRARQNCASFLATWLAIDWRLGAEWYESLLIDYDVASNYGNWAYVAGVGNDPRASEGKPRKFNPVKQGFDYDAKGEYVKTWIGEFSGFNMKEEWLFQAWKGLEKGDTDVVNKLRDIEWAKDPLVRINYEGRRRGASDNNEKGKSKGRGPGGKQK